MARTIVWLLVSTIVGGCLAHEPPVIDDAGTDAHAAVDAASRDVGHDAFARDANERDAPLEGCFVNVFITLTCTSPHVDVNLPDLSCSTSGPQCVRLDVAGRDSLDGATTNYCDGTGRLLGQPFGVNRCAPGSQQTTLRVTLLDAPTGGAGVVARAPDRCGCGGTATPMTQGETVALQGQVWDESIFDQFSFFGDGARYSVEACAYANCFLGL